MIIIICILIGLIVLLLVKLNKPKKTYEHSRVILSIPKLIDDKYPISNWMKNYDEIEIATTIEIEHRKSWNNKRCTHKLSFNLYDDFDDDDGF